MVIANIYSSKLTHLSIRRIDREPCRDWRDFQEIKNKICGVEFEAVELYPAESRVIDMANQFHLWVMTIYDFKFPFGFKDGRQIGTNEDASEIGAKQRNR
jgi:hypothetical protein